MELVSVRATVVWVYFTQLLVSVTMIELKTGNMFLRKGVRLTDEASMFEITTSTRLKCIDRCLYISTCFSVSWREQDGSCLLSNQITTDDSNVETKPLNTDFHIDWVTISKITSPIFHATGVNGRYTMLFTEAQDRCASLGASLASTADMLEARALGYDFCSCGWMADGSRAYTIQLPVSCGGIYTDGITYCNDFPLADAYCKFKVWDN